ncbi:MAG: uroporphyrinogen decarboxylase family protein [Candidatus Thorarchaeota archaeon]
MNDIVKNLNSHDLTLSAIKGKPERIPFNPFLMHLAANLASLDYNHQYCQDPQILVNSQIKCGEFFGIDHVNVSTDAYREANAWGVEIEWESHTPVAKKNLEIDEFASIETPNLLENQRIINRVDAVKLFAKEIGGTQCIVGWIEAPFAEICCLFGLINVLKQCKNQNWVEILKGLVERVVPVQKEFAKLQIEAGADIIGVGDSAISQIGPMRYENCCLDATKDLFHYIKKEIPVLYHVCGDNDIVDKEGRDMIKLISSTNADIIDFDYQVDLKKAKEKCGKNNCIRGNSNTTVFGDPSISTQDIVNEVSKTLKAGKPGGRYMYALGCEVPWQPIALTIRNLSIAKALTEKMGYY